MKQRPILNLNLDSKTFREFYYLKEELVKFCRENKLQTSGSKLELTERIAYFLDTGKSLTISNNNSKTSKIENINKDSKIEPNIVCSQIHRTFFIDNIGKGFSFNVSFQKWLKNKTLL